MAIERGQVSLYIGYNSSEPYCRHVCKMLDLHTNLECLFIDMALASNETHGGFVQQQTKIRGMNYITMLQNRYFCRIQFDGMVCVQKVT